MRESQRYFWKRVTEGSPDDVEVEFPSHASLQLKPLGEDRYAVEGEAVAIGAAIAVESGIWVHWDGNTYFLEKAKLERKRRGKGEGSGERVVTAPMPGKVRQVAVEAGQKVEKGDLLVILEAMKMEHRLLAPAAGEVKEVAVEAGDIVEAGKQLVEIL